MIMRIPQVHVLTTYNAVSKPSTNRQHALGEPSANPRTIARVIPCFEIGGSVLPVNLRSLVGKKIIAII